MFPNFLGWNRIQDDDTGGWLSSFTFGSSPAYGTYTTLVASTNFDCQALLLGVKGSGNGQAMMFKFAVGAAASEVAIIDGLCSMGQTGGMNNPTFLAPIAVKAGSRISFAHSEPGGGGTGYAFCKPVGGNLLLPFSGLKATSYGLVASTARGTTVTGAGANAKGSWVELTASCDRVQFGYLIIGSDASGAFTEFKCDIGIGGSGSEQTIIPNLPINQYYYSGVNALPLPMDIPAGTRIAIRVANVTGGSLTQNLLIIGFG